VKRLGLLLGVAALAGLVVLPRGLAQGQADNPHGDVKQDCADCHSAEGWAQVEHPKEFRHQQTGFPLEGLHADLACRSCHRDLVFSRVGTACADCHRDPHRGELGFRCEACHSPRTWSNRSEMFQAHNKTRFPLFAVHASVDCDACHRGQHPNQYATTPTACGQCHIRTFEQAQSPNHVLAGFSRRCEDCHAPNSPDWQRVTYRHPDTYPLLGAHAMARCGDCHKTAFAGTPRDCVACHRNDYNATTNPNHRSAGFPTSCNSCHSIEAWRPARFVDHSRTRFPLTGAHQQTDCGQCHVNNRFQGTPTDCVACHRQDYQGTTSPNHAAAGFPTSCQSCHSTNAWRPASNIDHNRTRFPLTGAHQGVSCERCHTGGRFAGTPRDCVSCHRQDYDRAQNPCHSGFPTQCEQCHSTSRWRPADFDHNRTGFPLTGAHRGAACNRCHSGGYAGTPTDCYACHASDYNGTSNPNHSAAGFPTDCAGCHSTNAWRPASFDHDGQFFPIYSGKHRGKWSSCEDCHVSPGNFGVFECINCHAHQQSEMNQKHHEVGGYVYQSQACYQCHPHGSGGD
jgi:Outer membrane cytochrome MtrC/MtrF-like, domains II/IV